MELYYLITITDRDKSQLVSDVYENADTNLTLTRLGQGTATDSHLSVYGLDATDKAIISTVVNGQQAAQIFKAARRKLFIDIPGNGIMLTVPLKSVAGGRTLAYLTDCEKSGGVPEMNFEHELIIVIANEGHSDYVMDAAREAGAGGGTVLHAKGTGGHRAEHFFGVSIANEKDMVYIVAHADEKAAIMKSIDEKAGPGTRAGAICFSLPISAVAGLRARDND